MDTTGFVQTTQMHVDPSVIDLGVGQPQFSLLPLEQMRRAAELRFAQNDPNFLQYGAEQGDGYLRRAVAQFLTQEYEAPVSTDNLFITNGASQGLDLVCTLYTMPGDTIFVEEPSYFLALRIFADHHLRIIPLPMDQDGLIIESLEEKLKEARPAFLYTIPTFQNPSGYTLSAERRDRLVQLSREHNFRIVADEVYHLLSFAGKPPKPLASYAGQGSIISLGSFSKILAPGLRLGWIQTDQEHVKSFVGCGLVDSGGGLNPFTAGIVRGLFENNGLKENILRLRSVYLERSAAMDLALRKYIPKATYLAPQGGYFFWVRLPGGQDAEALMQRAGEEKVSYRPGVKFSSERGLREFVRLCFAFYEVEDLIEGIKRLKRALK